MPHQQITFVLLIVGTLLISVALTEFSYRNSCNDPNHRCKFSYIKKYVIDNFLENQNTKRNYESSVPGSLGNTYILKWNPEFASSTKSYDEFQNMIRFETHRDKNKIFEFLNQTIDSKNHIIEIGCSAYTEYFNYKYLLFFSEQTETHKFQCIAKIINNEDISKCDEGFNILGYEGLCGIAGRIGEKGDNGDNGITGLPGAKGDNGNKGEIGEKGSEGSPGTKGLKGDNGTTFHD